jgi:hypothetical protein
MTVSWRRSGPCGACGSTGAGALPVPAATPQSPQNRLPMGFAPPHAAQRHGNGAPQSPQNRLPSGAVAPQRRQSIVFPSAQTRRHLRKRGTVVASKHVGTGGATANAAPRQHHEPDFQLAETGLCCIVPWPYRQRGYAREMS